MGAVECGGTANRLLEGIGLSGCFEGTYPEEEPVSEDRAVMVTKTPTPPLSPRGEGKTTVPENGSGSSPPARSGARGKGGGEDVDMKRFLGWAEKAK